MASWTLVTNLSLCVFLLQSSSILYSIPHIDYLSLKISMSSVNVFDPNETCKPNVLCSLCAAIVSRSKLLHRGVALTFVRMFKMDEEEELYSGYSTVQGLVNSSQTGCHLCSLLVHTIPVEDLKAFLSDNRSFGGMKIKIWQPRQIRRKDYHVKRLWQSSIQRHCLIALLSPKFNNLPRIEKFVGVVRTNSRKRSFVPGALGNSNTLYGMVVNYSV
jgi:hypothetical protein